MALTALAIPSQVPDYAAPFDAMLALATTGQVLTASGYMGAPNTIDLGGSTPVSAVGRVEGLWSIDITAIDKSSNDEFYQFCLFGSNDSAFGNGNVELLAFRDYAGAVAARVVPTILGISPTIPPTGKAGYNMRILFNNLAMGILYRYVRGYVVIGGTTPSVTIKESWLTKTLVPI